MTTPSLMRNICDLFIGNQDSHHLPETGREFCSDNYRVTSSILEPFLFNSKNWVTWMLLYHWLPITHQGLVIEMIDFPKMITVVSSSLFRHCVCVCLCLWMFSASVANWSPRLADARAFQSASHCCTIWLLPSFPRIHNWTACMRGKEG